MLIGPSLSLTVRECIESDVMVVMGDGDFSCSSGGEYSHV